LEATTRSARSSSPARAIASFLRRAADRGSACSGARRDHGSSGSATASCGKSERFSRKPVIAAVNATPLGGRLRDRDGPATSGSSRAAAMGTDRSRTAGKSRRLRWPPAAARLSSGRTKAREFPDPRPQVFPAPYAWRLGPPQQPRKRASRFNETPKPSRPPVAQAPPIAPPPFIKREDGPRKGSMHRSTGHRQSRSVAFS